MIWQVKQTPSANAVLGWRFRWGIELNPPVRGDITRISLFLLKVKFAKLFVFILF
jgi:hypothetical protein